MFQLLRIFVSCGVTKLRFTGGEPLLRPDFPEILQAVAELRAGAISNNSSQSLSISSSSSSEAKRSRKQAQEGQEGHEKVDTIVDDDINNVGSGVGIGKRDSDPSLPTGLVNVGITTNGILLGRHMDLISRSIDTVNVSLDTLDPHVFTLLTRRKGHQRVLQAIKDVASLQGPKAPKVKVNCVVTRGINSEEILDFVRLTQHLHVEVRFIEYMPFDGNRWSDKKLVSYKELLTTIQTDFPTFYRLEDHENDVSKTWKVPGFRGTVGFITSMTEHFCSSCNRIRLQADGNLKVCLFGSVETSLRDAMRQGASDEDLKLMISESLLKKKAKHAGMFEIAKNSAANRPMITIGG